ncbi:uncharacterized protein LOC119647564 isoform X1 [Hermetia illucens]|uniref:uncharacterized protein LOC119647564 isoform X1 n=1 Tax=Hermetia illucens TaxID=343691 RepID=UPI0018CC1994|nr:uncharacterized protein LOC119647564 isoform X1 [Hermetia illucens]
MWSVNPFTYGQWKKGKTDGNLDTNREFHSLNGLQPRTVTAPTLVFADELLNLLEFNESSKRSLIAFADDLISCMPHKKETEVELNFRRCSMT